LFNHKPDVGGLTVIRAVAVFDAPPASDAWNVKLSDPANPWSGV
jgi:hypothetical protein